MGKIAHCDSNWLKESSSVPQFRSVLAGTFAQSVRAQMDCGCAASAGNRELSARRIAISVLCL
jgi:hypothetical protein